MNHRVFNYPKLKIGVLASIRFERLAMVNSVHLMQIAGRSFYDDERVLHPLLNASYGRLIDSGSVKHARSELISREKVTVMPSGYIGIPVKVKHPVGSVVYFHGYGGNGAWNVELISDLFPEHLILCPSMGINCNKLDSRQVQDWAATAAASHGLQGTLASRPLLVSFLSQGFVPATEFVEKFKRRVCSILGLSSCPANARMYGDFPMLLVSGENDRRFLKAKIKRYGSRRSKAGYPTKCVFVEDADHFVSLSHRKSLLRTLEKHRDFLNSTG